MLLWILVFVLAAVFEAFYTYYTIAAAAHRAAASALWAVALTVVGGASTYLYVNDPWLLVPEVVGVGLGTYCAIRFDPTVKAP